MQFQCFGDIISIILLYYDKLINIMTNNIHNKQSIFDCFLTKLKNKENKNNNEKRQKHLRTFFLY